MKVCAQGRRGRAIAASMKFSGKPLTRGDYQHAVHTPTSGTVPIVHTEIEQAAGVQLSSVNGESSVTGVLIAVPFRYWSVAALDTGLRPSGHPGDAKFRDQQYPKPANADVQIRDQLTSEFAIKTTRALRLHESRLSVLHTIKQVDRFMKLQRSQLCSCRSGNGGCPRGLRSCAAARSPLRC